jgi:hypothetical protein
MAFMKNDYQERYEITPEEYDVLKKTQGELMKGRKRNPFTEETRNKMSIAQKNRFANPEERKKYSEMHSGENSYFYGKYHSEETKKKQSETKKGELNPNYGKHYSQEERKRLSELLSGENGPMYGKHHSEETRRKISEANTNPSEETRQKMREAKFGMYDGDKNPRAKAVMCLETKTIYGAASIASKQTGINATNIRQCCRGDKKSAGGYKWKFVYNSRHTDGSLILGAISLGLITEDKALKQTKQND